MDRYALIIHGWPSPVNKDHPLYRLLGRLGYKVIVPQIFKTDSKINPENIISLIQKRNYWQED
jgi:hypothetical protein